MVENGADITTISGTRLGLAVVGRIAQRYGLSVAYRSSSRGGTAVVLPLPQRLIKPLPAVAAPAPATPAREAPEATPSDEPTPTDEPAPRLANGLPQRRRGRTLAAVERTRTTSPADSGTPADTGPSTSQKGFGAFRSAVRGPADSSKDT